MPKQPYIPLYTGDYLKISRILTLAARGAWTDLQVFMWDAEQRGTIVGRLSDFARMLGTSPEEADKVLLELCSNRIYDRKEAGGGRFQLVDQDMIRKSAISERRKAAGSEGGKVAQAKFKAIGKAKLGQNHDTDNGIETATQNGKEVQEENQLDEYGRWSDSVIADNDPVFAGMEVRERWPPGFARTDLVRDHLGLLHRYPKMRPQSQQSFRESLMKHLRENRNGNNNSTRAPKNGAQVLGGQDYTKPL